jgi:4,5-dihydroxyphthalate decarboxylase
MLAKGEIDALFSARAPSCFLRGAPNVGRLFPDYPAVELAYFRKTRIFPIMHAIGIRRSLVERHPWLAVSVYKAFLKAKALATHELGQIGHLAVTLPWSVAEYDRVRAAMGEDYWPYGVAENRHVLETLMGYSFAQGLSPRKLALDEMFAPATADLSKI